MFKYYSMLDFLIVYIEPYLEEFVKSILLTWYCLHFLELKMHRKGLVITAFTMCWAVIRCLFLQHIIGQGFFATLFEEVLLLVCVSLLIHFMLRAEWKKAAVLSITYHTVYLISRFFIIGIEGTIRKTTHLFKIDDASIDHIKDLSIDMIMENNRYILKMEIWTGFTDILVIVLILYLLTRSFRKIELKISGRELSYVMLPLCVGWIFFALYQHLTVYHTGSSQFPTIPDQEYVIICIACSFIMLIMAAMSYENIYIVQRLSASAKEQSERLLLEREVMAMKKQMLEMDRMNQNIREIRHDMKNHIAVLMKLTSDNRLEELKDYLLSVNTDVEKLDERFHTGSVVVDALLSVKALEAEHQNGSMDFEPECQYGSKALETEKQNCSNVLKTKQQYDANVLEAKQQKYSNVLETKQQVHSNALETENPYDFNLFKPGHPNDSIVLDAEEFVFPDTLAISEYDVCIILGNAIDNAIEAYQRMDKDVTAEQEASRHEREENVPMAGVTERSVTEESAAEESTTKTDSVIHLRSFMRNNMYFIEVKNSYNGELRMEDGSHFPLTIKEHREDHGIGFTNMMNIAKKYHGSVDFEAKNDIFTLTVMLQNEEY